MKNEQQMLDMLRSELQKSSDSANIPLRLQKESIVTMLKNDEHKETDFSVKTGNGKSNVIAIRRLMSVAAMITLVIVGALAMRNDGVQVVKKDTFYKSYEGAELVRSARGYEDVEEVVREILSKETTQSQNKLPTAGADENQSVTDESTESPNKLYEGYSVLSESEEMPDEAVYASGVSVSKTEVAVSADDVNADIVKSDGEYLYILTTGVDTESGNMTEHIKIVKAVPVSEMNVVSTVTLSDNVVAGAFEECIEIYLKDNILIALLGKKDFASEAQTRAVYYDISNPEAPLKIREHIQEGKYFFSSLNENVLCLVTDKHVSAMQSNLIPSFTVNGETTTLADEDIFISVNDPEASYIFITATDISSYEKPAGRLAILGSGKQIYCSEQTITVAREFVSVEFGKNGNSSSFTEIYRFDVNGPSISYSGSYVVEGSLLGGVSVDKQTGHLYAATAAAESSNIYVLDNSMEFTSGLQKIFPQKKVDGVKFIGSKGYVLSGDETMIIDLSSPKSPKVAGTIPSKLFAGNLYEVSQTKLLGINSNSDGSVTFRLFDVSDSENPSVASTYTLESIYSPLSTADSRSVLIIPEKEIFGVPFLLNNTVSDSESSVYMLYDYSTGEITCKGMYCHAESYIGDAAVRATHVDGMLYTVSGEKTVAFNLDNQEQTAACEIR